MTFILVLLFWAALIGYVPFHFRKAVWVRSFFAGFNMVWYALATATEPDSSDWVGDGDMDAAERGGIAAIVSMVIAVLTLLAFAGFTLAWAW